MAPVTAEEVKRYGDGVATRALRLGQDPRRELAQEAWLEHSYVLEKGGRYSFDGHEPLRAIAADTHRKIAFMKSAQVGATALYVGLSIHACGVQGRHRIYYFPTDSFLAGHVRPRVYPCFDHSTYLSALARDRSTQNIIFKGGGILYHRGLKAEMGVHSIPADDVVFDEVDRADAEQAEKALERVEHSQDPGYYYCSTPTIPGFGIAKIYDDRSDRRTWRVKCSSCRKWSKLLWENVVVQTGDYEYELRDTKWDPARDGRDVRIHCERCGKPLQRLGAGKWIADKKGAEYHGYKISRLFSPRHTIASLWERFQEVLGNEMRTSVFMNAVLGEPYAASGSKLTVADLDAACGEHMPQRAGGYVVVGADIGPGSGHHYWVVEVESKRLIEIGATNWAGLRGVLKRHNVVAAVIDKLPEKTKAKELMREFPDVWLAEYPPATDIADILAEEKEEVDVEGVAEEVKTVKLNRTAMCDEFVRLIRTGDISLPANASSLGKAVPERPYNALYAQLMAPVRSYVEDKRRGGVRAVWRETGPDHYFHAGVYAVAALALAGGSGVPYVAPAVVDLSYA